MRGFSHILKASPGFKAGVASFLFKKRVREGELGSTGEFVYKPVFSTIDNYLGAVTRFTPQVLGKIGGDGDG